MLLFSGFSHTQLDFSLGKHYTHTRSHDAGFLCPAGAETFIDLLEPLT